MKTKLSFILLVLAMIAQMYFVAAALAEEKFITSQFLDMSAIAQVSKFRSGAGHDFSYEPPYEGWGYNGETDPTETERSMKHYFLFADGVNQDEFVGDDHTYPIYAPFSGQIYRVTIEGQETGFLNKQVWLTPDSDPQYNAILFHVNLVDTFPQAWNDYPADLWPYHVDNDTTYERLNVVAGEFLGYADRRAGPATDFAVLKNISDYEKHYVSYFECLTDPLLKEFQDRGAGLEDLIISKEYRDAHPIPEEWWQQRHAEDWVELGTAQTAPEPISAVLFGVGGPILWFFRKKK